jgi:hypothetical protein
LRLCGIALILTVGVVGCGGSGNAATTSKAASAAPASSASATTPGSGQSAGAGLGNAASAVPTGLTGSTKATICTRGGAAVARKLGVGAARLTAVAGTASSGSPICHFTARLGAGGTVHLSVEVDIGPQPYFILERTIVEATQIFGAKRFAPAPLPINGLGIEAAWFPTEQHVIATEGLRLVTATVSWPHSPQSRRRGLAIAATRAYLGKNDWKAADQGGE